MHRKPLATMAALVWLLAAGTVAAGEIAVLPDPNLTGGSVRTDNPDLACGHAKENRHSMTPARANEVLRRYGLPTGRHPDYEIDHLIPLCLGGADDASNLWPQPHKSIEPMWNALAKDWLEHRLCRLVCEGKVSLPDAQVEIATDWTDAYQKYWNEGLARPSSRHFRSDWH